MSHSGRPRFATADEIAAALIMACRLTDAEDPGWVAAGHDGPRARPLAALALIDALPRCDVAAIARGVGFKGASRSAITGAMRSAWWRPNDLRLVIRAVRGISDARPTSPPKQAEASALIGRAPCQLPLPSASIFRTPTGGRIIDRRMPAQPVNLGDPGPGRSALDQRDKGGAST